MDVMLAGGVFEITGPRGTYRVAPANTRLALTYYQVSAAGITDYEALFTAVWALCVPGVVDTITFAWRTGDPYETDTVRQRSEPPSNT